MKPIALLFVAASQMLLLQPVCAQTSTPVSSAPLLARSVTLALKVPDYKAMQNVVLEAARAHHADLMDAKVQVDAKGRTHGWLRLRVGAAQLPNLLADLRLGGKLYAENVVTTDGASQFEELGRRVTRLQQHEVRLGGVLQSPRRMRGSDILYLQERLFRASVDESLLSQQRVDLERGARDSTLLVELFEPGTLPPGVPTRINLGSWFQSADRIAQATRDRQFARGATAMVWALVYAPLWAPVALLALILLALIWRHRRPLGRLVIQLVTAGTILLMRLVAWLRRRWENRSESLFPMRYDERRSPPN